MEEKMGFFTKFSKSLYDFKSYISFKKESTGKAFLYLFLMSLLIGLISIIRPIYQVNNAFKIGKEEFNNSIQELNFKNGVLEVKSSKPISIMEDSFALIVDTDSEEADPDKIKGYPNAMLFYKDVAYFKSNWKVQQINYDEIQNLEINKQDVNKYIGIMKSVVYVCIAFMPIGIFIKNMFTALIIALFALVIGAIQKNEQSFGDMYKLSIYALTLPSLVSLLNSSTGMKIPHFYSLYCLIAIIYMWFVIKAIKEQETQLD